MKTRVFSFSGDAVPPEAIQAATESILDGGVVLIPTDTVYGLACNPFNAEAVRRVYALKGRSYKKPLPILMGDEVQLPLVTEEILPEAKKLMARFWPGALTLVFKTGPLAVHPARGRTTIAVRLPDHGPSRNLLNALRLPLAATSANPSNQPSTVSGKEALEFFDGFVDVALDGGTCAGQIASSVVDVTHYPFTVIREGALSKETLIDALA